MLKRWSTRDVPPRMARDYWLELVKDRIFKTSIDLPLDATLDAELTQANCGPLNISWVDSPARKVLLPADAAERIHPSADVQLFLMHDSDWMLETGGDHFHVQPGDILVSTVQRAFAVSRNRPTTTTAISLSKAWLQTWIPAFDFQRPEIIRARDGWGLVLSAALRQLTPRRVATFRDRERLLANQVGSLLSLAFHERMPRFEAVSEDVALAETAKVCMQRRLGEHGLTAARVAEELGVSERTLHRAFASNGISFARELREERMIVAKRLLGDPHFSLLSISEIGRRLGFSDASHFIRCFKAAHGVTPAALQRASMRSRRDRAGR